MKSPHCKLRIGLQPFWILLTLAVLLSGCSVHQANVPSKNDSEDLRKLILESETGPLIKAMFTLDNNTIKLRKNGEVDLKTVSGVFKTIADQIYTDEAAKTLQRREALGINANFSKVRIEGYRSDSYLIIPRCSEKLISYSSKIIPLMAQFIFSEEQSSFDTFQNNFEDLLSFDLSATEGLVLQQLIYFVLSDQVLSTIELSGIHFQFSRYLAKSKDQVLFIIAHELQHIWANTCKADLNLDTQREFEKKADIFATIVVSEIEAKDCESYSDFPINLLYTIDNFSDEEFSMDFIEFINKVKTNGATTNITRHIGESLLQISGQHSRDTSHYSAQERLDYIATTAHLMFLAQTASYYASFLDMTFSEFHSSPFWDELYEAVAWEFDNPVQKLKTKVNKPKNRLCKKIVFEERDPW